MIGQSALRCAERGARESLRLPEDTPMTLRSSLLGGCLAICSVLATPACSGGDDDDSADDTARPAVDPNLPPMTNGTWYRPGVSATWQWQLTGTLHPAYQVEVYDVDLFENDAASIAALHALGFKAICYFSAGSSEDWRPDSAGFAAADKGKQLSDWAGENWLDIRSDNVFRIMQARLDQAQSKACDGVEPDNVDGYENDTGFPLTEDDQLRFNRRLANEAHQRGLAVALKNEGRQVPQLVSYFDLSVNEQCHELNQCAELQPFSAAGKPIFNAEYAADQATANSLGATVCPRARADNTRTLILPVALDDSFRVSCD
jgi:hypothetical protein